MYTESLSDSISCVMVFSSFTFSPYLEADTSVVGQPLQKNLAERMTSHPVRIVFLMPKEGSKLARHVPFVLLDRNLPGNHLSCFDPLDRRVFGRRCHTFVVGVRSRHTHLQHLAEIIARRAKQTTATVEGVE